MTQAQGRPFIIIGENIHCSRRVKREGSRVKTDAQGNECVVFEDEFGNEALLPVPEVIRNTETYRGGHIPHVAAAVRLGMEGSPAEREIGRSYIRWLARRQVMRGAHYLDVNVDELSPEIRERDAAMVWCVELLSSSFDLPLSIDSSELSTLRAGVEAVMRVRGPRPMVNSASLERVQAIELAARHRCPTIVMASGEAGLPAGVEDRVANLERIIELCIKAGLGVSDLFADPLIYTVSAAPGVAVDVLETCRRIRARYPDIHIAGGHSNISFGLPNRRLLNAVWLQMAMEAGVDSGLIDPLTCHPDDVARLDLASEAVRLARAGFLREDEHFMEYIMAFREKRLQSPF